MASKRKSKRRKKQGKFSFKKFLKSLVVSAVSTFVVATWAINPHVLDDLSVDGLINRVTAFSEKPVPVAVSSDDYVQTSFANCKQFFPGEKPPIVPGGQSLRELCFTPFAVLHSGQTKTPVFVAERLNRKMLLNARNIKRNDRFYEEARLPAAERSTLADYRGSGYDRGHMAPAGDMFNDEAMAQSFSLANIVPQDAHHNRGPWSKIEEDTRKYILRAKGDVYVFTGPVFSEDPATIGQGKVAIPTYIYKLVYDATTGKSWVHWHENSARAKAGPPISYDEFVRRTGMYLLPVLSEK